MPKKEMSEAEALESAVKFSERYVDRGPYEFFPEKEVVHLLFHHRRRKPEHGAVLLFCFERQDRRHVAVALGLGSRECTSENVTEMLEPVQHVLTNLFDRVQLRLDYDPLLLPALALSRAYHT